MVLIKILSRRLFKDVLSASQDQLAMEFLTPLYNSYLPWSTAAIRPSGIVKIINEILIYKRRCIVECGGGISTLFIAQILKKQGGHLYTIEHDQEWSLILKGQIDKLELNEYVSVITSPLVKSDLSIANSEQFWYDHAQIKQNIHNISIDLLLVDGPPAYLKTLRYSRYPALIFFQPYFAKDYSIILDDIDRVGERKIIKEWQKLTKIDFDKFLIDGGLAIGRTKKTFTV
ncbi:class I SAM-dependent methyltransferase [Anabaena minutissima FACHB-250]|nr:class I SAM-dependent methyltransferase [Anabaena minutissima FACHB-250]